MNQVSKAENYLVTTILEVPNANIISETFPNIYTTNIMTAIVSPQECLTPQGYVLQFIWHIGGAQCSVSQSEPKVKHLKGLS